MWDWWEELLTKLGHHAKPQYRRRFHREFLVSEQALNWVRARPLPEQLAFAELLLRLDGDPTEHSYPVLQTDVPPGTRYAPFDAHQAVIVFDIAANRVHVLLCH